MDRFMPILAQAQPGIGGGSHLVSVVLPILIVVALVVIFLICRELNCWYWKINRIVELLEKIAGNSGGAKNPSIYPQSANAKTTAQAPSISEDAKPALIACPQCGCSNGITKEGFSALDPTLVYHCPKCGATFDCK